MAADTDLTDTIVSVANGPAASTVDGLSVTEQPLLSLLEAQKQLGQDVAASANKQRGLRFTKLINPGAV